MASTVEQQLEPSAHELQLQVRLGLLSLEEARFLQERRRRFEYRISTRSATVGLSNYLRYVAMELNLLCLIRARGAEALHALRRLLRQEEKTSGKKKGGRRTPSRVGEKQTKHERRAERVRKSGASFLKACVGRVCNIFSRLLLRLQGKEEKTQLEVWMSFIDVLLQLGASRELQKQLMKALATHPRCGALWSLSAERLLQQGQIAASRKVLLLALRFLPADATLWAELLRLEASAVYRLASARFKRQKKIQEQEASLEAVDGALAEPLPTAARMSEEVEVSKQLSLKPLLLILNTACQRLASEEPTASSRRDSFLLKALDVSLLFEAACTANAPGVLPDEDLAQLQSRLAEMIGDAAVEQPLLAVLALKFALLNALQKEGADRTSSTLAAFDEAATRAETSYAHALVFAVFVDSLAVLQETTGENPSENKRESQSAIENARENEAPPSSAEAVKVFFDTEGEDSLLLAESEEAAVAGVTLRDGAALLEASSANARAASEKAKANVQAETGAGGASALCRSLREGGCVKAAELLALEPSLHKICLLEAPTPNAACCWEAASSGEPSLLADPEALRRQSEALRVLGKTKPGPRALLDLLRRLAKALLERERKEKAEDAARSALRRVQEEAFLRRAALEALSRASSRWVHALCSSLKSEAASPEELAAVLQRQGELLEEVLEAVPSVSVWKTQRELCQLCQGLAGSGGGESALTVVLDSAIRQKEKASLEGQLATLTGFLRRVPAGSVAGTDATFLAEVWSEESRLGRRVESGGGEAFFVFLNSLQVRDGVPLAMRCLAKLRSEDPLGQASASSQVKASTTTSLTTPTREASLRTLLSETRKLASQVASCGVRVSAVTRLQALCSLADVGLEALAELLSETPRKGCGASRRAAETDREALVGAGVELFRKCLEAFDEAEAEGHSARASMRTGKASSQLPNAKVLRQRWSEECVCFLRFAEQILPNRTPRERSKWLTSTEFFAKALKTVPDPSAFERRLARTCSRSGEVGGVCANDACRESGRWCLDT